MTKYGNNNKVLNKSGNFFASFQKFTPKVPHQNNKDVNTKMEIMEEETGDRS